MQDVIVRALALILIIVLGYFIKRIGWVTKDDFGIFSKIVLRITLPCAIITSFNEVNIAASMTIYIVVGFLANVVLGGFGFLVGKNKGKEEQAFNILNYGSYNIGAFTIPFISSFLGTSGIVIVSLFDVGNSLSASGLNYSLAKSITDTSNKISLKRIIDNMFSSILFITYIVMLVIRLLGVKLPPQIITFTSIVGSANTFLAMLMIGIAFEINLESSKLQKSIKGLVNRYIISIMMALIVYFILPIPTLGKTILTIILFSPIASMTPALTKEIDGDLESSSFMNSASIIIGIIIMTILLTIL